MIRRFGSAIHRTAGAAQSIPRFIKACGVSILLISKKRLSGPAAISLCDGEKP
jgi:hypothetical protein